VRSAGRTGRGGGGGIRLRAGLCWNALYRNRGVCQALDGAPEITFDQVFHIRRVTMKRYVAIAVLAVALLLLSVGVAVAITNGQPDGDNHPFSMGSCQGWQAVGSGSAVRP